VAEIGAAAPATAPARPAARRPLALSEFEDEITRAVRRAPPVK